MKRLLILALLTALLAGCAMPDLSYLLPAVPTATGTQTITPSPTTTLAPGETRLPTATATITDTPTETAMPASATPPFTPTFTKRPTITLPPAEGFSLVTGIPVITSVLISGDLIRWGACGGTGPYEITFTVRVTRVKRLYYVLLFMRLQDKYSWVGTDWFGGAIMKADANKVVYTYTITKENITNYELFSESWLEFQVVAADSSRNVLGRSPVHRGEINIVQCATPTPKSNP